MHVFLILHTGAKENSHDLGILVDERPGFADLLKGM